MPVPDRNRGQAPAGIQVNLGGNNHRKTGFLAYRILYRICETRCWFQVQLETRNGRVKYGP